MLDKYKQKCPTSTRLINDLNPKKNVRLSVVFLQSILKTGARVSKVHRVAVFKQTNWMKKFILYYTEKRNNSLNAFEKAFYKLIINSNFGKLCENVKLYSNVELIR